MHNNNITAGHLIGTLHYWMTARACWSHLTLAVPPGRATPQAKEDIEAKKQELKAARVERQHNEEYEVGGTTRGDAWGEQQHQWLWQHVHTAWAAMLGRWCRWR